MHFHLQKLVDALYHIKIQNLCVLSMHPAKVITSFSQIKLSKFVLCTSKNQEYEYLNINTEIKISIYMYHTQWTAISTYTKFLFSKGLRLG